MSVMGIMVEPRRVTVFFDRRNPSNSADRRRIERAVASAITLAAGEVADAASETLPLAA